MDENAICTIIYNHIKQTPDKRQLKIVANSKYRLFLSDTAPVPSIDVVKKFISRILSRCHLQDEQILQGYMLILLFCKKTGVSINPYSWQRLFIISFQLLNKYFNDRYVWVHQIAQIGQFDEIQFVKMEKMFCIEIEYNFYYGEDQKNEDLNRLKDEGLI